MSVKPLWYPIERERPGRAASGSEQPPLAVVRPGTSPIEPDPTRRARRRRPPAAADADPHAAAGRGRAALLAAVPRLELDDPMLPAALAFTPPDEQGVPATRILGSWRLRRDGQRREEAEPWPIGAGATPNSPVYDTDDHAGAHWRELEIDDLDRDPEGYALRLIAPITLAANVEFLATWAAASDAVIARTAAELLAEVRPEVEASLSDAIRGLDPWRDTFALWLLVRHPRALAELHPLVLAAAARYGTLASRMAGLVYGTDGPFAARPLVSATAHLGLTLWTLDYRPTLLSGIVGFVRGSMNADGGFGDPGQPSDVLTTLAAAELLSTLAPDWDPAPTAAWFARTQEPDGWWRALDPEVPWLTGAVVEWLESADRPFSRRFRWPEYQRLDRDRKTGIPGFAAFDRLVRVFSTLDSLAGSPVEVAFVDLAGFREFNKAHGQQRGDDVLRAFAQELARIPGVLAIRDGGDEFLVVGAPGDGELHELLGAFRASWPARFVARFGREASPVAPRVLVAHTTGREVGRTREVLGEQVEPVKGEYPEPGPEGVLVDLEAWLSRPS